MPSFLSSRKRSRTSATGVSASTQPSDLTAVSSIAVPVDASADPSRMERGPTEAELSQMDMPPEIVPDRTQRYVEESSRGHHTDTEEMEDEEAIDDEDDEDGRRNKRSRASGHARFAKKPRVLSKQRILSVWDAVRQQLRNPSHPSTTSQSNVEPGGTVSGGGSLRRPGGSLAGRSASGYDGQDADEAAENEPVHHVVVDSDLGLYIPPAKSDNGSAATPGNTGRNTTTTDGSHLGHTTGSNGDGSSIRRENRANWIKRSWVWEVTVDRCWPAVKYFCESSFPEPAKEKAYLKESWFAWRPAAVIASLFYVIAWVLTAALLPSHETFNLYGYVGITGFFIIPLPFFVIMDWARHRPILYQVWLLCATWVFTVIVIVDMFRCGFYSPNRRCGTKDFLGLFYWSIGLPVLAIMALGQKRDYHMLGMLQWVVLVAVLILAKGSPALMYRNFVNFLLFHIFLLFTSYLKEKSDRQVFSLRQQLKLQWKATQKAQVAERKAFDSKRQFQSYIFHEVRVPLNTAVLAIQNLDGENCFDQLQPDQKDLLHGLKGSLSTMEQVIDDVLSYSRMESGKFTQARKPFSLHSSIQLVHLSHRPQAMSKGLKLNIELDPEIDRLGGTFIGDEMRLRQVMSNLVSNACKFTTTGEVKIVTKLLYPRTDASGNTPPQSPTQEKVVQLEYSEKQEEHTARTVGQDYNEKQRRSSYAEHNPNVPDPSPADSEKTLMDVPARATSPESRPKASREGGLRDSMSSSARPGHFGVRIPNRPAETKAIIRVAVHDTGVGLQKRDVVDNRLFSPYVQTEIGRRQGGKGSGLGLALCMQIIRLMGGRVGVDSQYGQGSTFWFEVALHMPPPKTSDWARGPANPNHAKHMAPPVLVSDKLYEGKMDDAMPTRPEPAHIDSAALAFKLEADTLNRRMEATVRAGASDGVLPVAPAQAAMQMMEKGLISPSLSHAMVSQERRNSEMTMVAGSPGKDRNTADASDSAQKEPAKPKQRAVVDGGDPLQALVVDDDPLTRKLMARLLTRLGHQVSTAENGQVALDMVRERDSDAEGWGNQYHIVFLDNQMPVKTGIEVAKELRKQGSKLFIVGATGNALREDQQEYLDAGADQVLTKPLKEASIREMITAARQRVAGETEPRSTRIRRDGPRA